MNLTFTSEYDTSHLRSLLVRTPLIRHPLAPNTCLHLKAENLQAFGSYKLHGILSVFERTNPILLQKGVVVASAGNMAQAVAYAARQQNIPCTALVPTTAPQVKKDAIRHLGATIEELPFEHLWKFVMDPAGLQSSGYFIHPIVTPYLVQGYQTIAEEILTELPLCDAIVVPFGVGGLSLGIAQYLQLRAPQIDLYVCEPETAAPMHAALNANKSIRVSRQPGFVDAIGTPEVLPAVFSALSHLLTGSIVVSLAEIRAAMSVFYQQHERVVEPAGAAALAAGIRLTREKPDTYSHVACIITGGNISFEQFTLIVTAT